MTELVVKEVYSSLRDMHMNITHVIGNPPTTMNGVVISALTSRAALIAAGHQANLIVPAQHAPLPESGVRTLPGIALPWNRDYFFWLASSTDMARVMATLETEIVHAHHLFQTGELARAATLQLGRPLVVTMHTDLENYVHHLLLLPLAMRRALMRRHIRDLLNRVDQIIVPTQPVGELLAAYGVKRPIAINPTGITVADYLAQASDADLIALGISPARPFLLYVGRLAVEKNPWLLLEAFRRYIHPQYLDLQLVLVGPGPLEKTIRRWLQKYDLENTVVVTGRVNPPRLKPLFRRALFFVYPSSSDTQAIVVVEAMAAGRAVVAIQRLGPAAIVIDGVTGRLVRHWPQPHERDLQIRLFAAAIHEMIVEEAARIACGARAEEQAAAYDLAVTTATQLKIYHSLL
jgi:glycosyltransferase involved in cell wall biosynthesis